MQTIKGLENLPTIEGHSAVAIGNFDGIHLGHQKILERLVQQASIANLSSILLTFSPHPEKTLGESKIKMIQTLEQRLEKIERFNINIALVIDFDREFSNLTGRAFIQRVLVNVLKAKRIIVGKNFRFGKKREGNVPALERAASRYGFKVHSVPPLKTGKRIISSSLVRKLIEAGDIERANRLLGRSYEISGIVVKGKSRGKDLGFPTANIKTPNEILPHGVFISKALIDTVTFTSLTHIGACPTFQEKEANIETYIIDFDGDIYKKEIRVFFIKKLREEKRFATAEALSKQIRRDLQKAADYFR